MTQAVLDTLFQPFEQGNANISKEFGGTGLGLAISKKIINLFGGDISVETKVGAGSKFMFTIELTYAKAIEEEKEIITDVKNSLVNKRCLLVDDVDMNRLIVVSLLEDTGLEIEEASDGSDAVNMFIKSDLNYYDIILMDIRMPRVNGYDATEMIRKLNRSDAKTCPIVALTANTFKEDIDAATKAGMNSHLAKPIEFDKLMSVLFRYLKKK
jgi:CheY-like chemotaxis protein